MQHVGGMAERRESKKVMKFEERNWKAEFVIYCTDVIGKCWRQTRLEGKTAYSAWNMHCLRLPLDASQERLDEY